MVTTDDDLQYLDEFFSAAEKCRAKVEKCVWKPGPNAPKGVAP